MTVKEQIADPSSLTIPPHDVILHNDDVNEYSYVVQAVQKAVGLSHDEAEQVVYTAHTTGKALVVSCSLELAELYQERLASFDLTVTIEPA